MQHSLQDIGEEVVPQGHHAEGHMWVTQRAGAPPCKEWSGENLLRNAQAVAPMRRNPGASWLACGAWLAYLQAFPADPWGLSPAATWSGLAVGLQVMRHVPPGAAEAPGPERDCCLDLTGRDGVHKQQESSLQQPGGRGSEVGAVKLVPALAKRSVRKLWITGNMEGGTMKLILRNRAPW